MGLNILLTAKSRADFKDMLCMVKVRQEQEEPNILVQVTQRFMQPTNFFFETNKSVLFIYQQGKC